MPEPDEKNDTSVEKAKEETDEKKAVDLLKHIKELAQLKYDSEEKREQGLIQQSSQMQTAFSFVSVAVLMILPIFITERGNISISFFIWAGSFIILPLLASLVIACLAQWRWKTRAFPDIDILYDFIDEKFDEAEKESQRLKQWIGLVKEVQKEKSRLNNRRVKLIMASMLCFYASIGLCVFWFFAGITRLI